MSDDIITFISKSADYIIINELINYNKVEILEKIFDLNNKNKIKIDFSELSINNIKIKKIICNYFKIDFWYNFLINTNELCIICHDQAKIKSLCNHYYCKECINIIFDKNNSCSYCSQKLF